MSTKYTKEVLQDAAVNSFSYAGMLRHLGLRQAGGTQTHIANMVKKFDIDVSHFTGKIHNKGKAALNKKSAEEVLVVLPEDSARPRRKQLLRAMLEKGLTYECVRCYNKGTWLGEPLTLEVDHLDGNWLNNLLDNLRFLCPNCHGQCESTNRPHKYRMPA